MVRGIKDERDELPGSSTGDPQSDLLLHGVTRANSTLRKATENINHRWW
jgi:hypothetical protein